MIRNRTHRQLCDDAHKRGYADGLRQAVNDENADRTIDARIFHECAQLKRELAFANDRIQRLLNTPEITPNQQP